jgi:CheY-like chemotaxis protein
MSQHRVLIVDDDPHLVEVLQLRFGEADLEVLVAGDGEQALRTLRESGDLDLVLTDFMMPEMNGIELIRAVKSNAQLFDTRIVVMSNNADPTFRKKALDLGAAAYLLKTIGARTIAEKVIQLIKGPAASQGTGPAARQSNPQASLAQYILLLDSLVEIIRFTARTEGLPPAAKEGLASAQKLAENIRNSMSDGAPPRLSPVC